LQGIVTLGKEWRYYKKELEQQRRAKKKAEEKANERMGKSGGVF
jgi:hypothetical protein